MNISIKKINILGTKQETEENKEENKEEQEYLAFFRAKQQLMYSKKEKKKEINLDKLPKDIFDEIFSYIPEYIITWFSDNTWTIMIKAIKYQSLYDEYRNRVNDYDDYDDYYYDYDDYHNYYECEEMMIRELREDDEIDREYLRELYSIKQLRLDNRRY